MLRAECDDRCVSIATLATYAVPFATPYDEEAMAVPQVAIVGRPNVGKSSIFNWLAGRRIAIVDDMPGVTRDRNIYQYEDENLVFDMVDTGGMGIKDTDDLTADIERQIEVGIREADLILFIVDTRAGLATLDQEVAKRLRGLNTPVVLVCNKADQHLLDTQADEFHRLGFEPLVRISVHQNRNKYELLEAIATYLPKIKPYPDEDPTMKVTLVGRRNVGKSTFINSLTKTERMIVSEIPGTTRDSIDVRFELDGKSFMAIDTPGLRKNKSVRTDIDFYGMHRAQRAVRRADVVLMFFDCSQRISKVDKQLCNHITDYYKPCLFVVNKWDLMKDQMPTEEWSDYIHDTFPTLTNAPIAFMTAQTGQNLKMVINHAQMLFKQSLERVSTGVLNRLVKSALQHHPPPMMKLNKRPKIYYVTQIGVQPPTIVFICNNPKGFPRSYRRYLLGVLQDRLNFGEVPLRLFFDKRETANKDARDALKEIVRSGRAKEELVEVPEAHEE
ncbi:MAG: GTP-binding protein [Pirellulaceae bacterium]